jgi:hypothetical protein
MLVSIRKYIPWVAILFLLFLLLSGVRVGVAELYSMNARVTMESWDTAQRFPTPEEIRTVQQQLEFARDLAINDPEQHENIARLSLVRAAVKGISEAERTGHLQDGLAEIRTAIALRPVSPYSWAILAMIKRDLGEFDPEFLHALHRSVELGPWEPELLVSLADVGLTAWPKVPPEEQDLIQRIFVRGLEHQSKSIQDVAKGHRNECAGKSGVVCQ